MTPTRPLWTVSLAVVLTSCASPAPPDLAAVRSRLDSTLAHHAELFKAKDVAGLMAAYSDAPVVYSDHVLPVRGRPALETFLQAFTHGGEVHSLEYRTEELAVHGDSAWQILSYRVRVTPTGSDQVVADSGSGFALWVRDSGGVWRIHRDIFNSSVGLPVPAKD